MKLLDVCDDLNMYFLKKCDAEWNLQVRHLLRLKAKARQPRYLEQKVRRLQFQRLKVAVRVDLLSPLSRRRVEKELRLRLHPFLQKAAKARRRLRREKVARRAELQLFQRGRAGLLRFLRVETAKVKARRLFLQQLQVAWAWTSTRDQPI